MYALKIKVKCIVLNFPHKAYMTFTTRTFLSHDSYIPKYVFLNKKKDIDSFLRKQNNIKIYRDIMK